MQKRGGHTVIGGRDLVDMVSLRRRFGEILAILVSMVGIIDLMVLWRSRHRRVED